MGAYILRRLLLMIPTLLGILFVSFVVIQFAPGGPVERIIAQLTGDAAAARDAIREFDEAEAELAEVVNRRSRRKKSALIRCLTRMRSLRSRRWSKRA